MFQLSYNAICVPVLFLKIRGRLQGHVPHPLFFGALVLCLVHPTNITCLARFHNALDFESSRLGPLLASPC